MSEAQAVTNNDKELWREIEGDVYSPSIHVTDDGMIGISLGGTVHIKDVRKWHNLAEADMEEGLWGSDVDSKMSQGIQRSSYTELQNQRYELTKLEKIAHYLNLLYEAQRSDHRVDKEIDDALKQFKTEVGI